MIIGESQLFVHLLRTYLTRFHPHASCLIFYSNYYSKSMAIIENSTRCMWKRGRSVLKNKTVEFSLVPHDHKLTKFGVSALVYAPPKLEINLGYAGRITRIRSLQCHAKQRSIQIFILPTVRKCS